MSSDAIRGSGVPDPRYRMPEMPRCYAGETNALQRLFALANLQVQRARQEAEEERQKDVDCQSALVATEQHTAGVHLRLDQCLEFIVDQARRISGSDGAAIALRDGRDFICGGRSGVLAPDLGAKVDPQSGVSGACLRTGEVQQCDDTESDSRVEPSVCRGQGIRSILAVPVRRGEILGILAVFSGRAGIFNERDVRALNSLAELVVAQLTQNPLDVAGIAQIQPGRPESETTKAPYTAEPTGQCDAEMPPAMLEVREEARGRWGWRPLKSGLLTLVVLAITSEVVVWGGSHAKHLFRMAKVPFAMSGAMPYSSSPAIPKPSATVPRPRTVLKTVPGRTPTPTPAPDWKRASKNEHEEKGPPAPIGPLPDGGLRAPAVPNPPNGRIEGPVNLHSFFADLQRILQPQPVNPEVNTTSPVLRTGDTIHEPSQHSAGHETTKSQPGSGQILEFRGELQDRMHMSRVVGVVGVRFSIYSQPQGGAPLWQEVQSVEVDQFGHFSAQVGSSSVGGFPQFARGLWLGWLVQRPGEVERRMWLVDTPSGLRGEGAVGRIVDRD